LGKKTEGSKGKKKGISTATLGHWRKKKSGQQKKGLGKGTKTGHLACPGLKKKKGSSGKSCNSHKTNEVLNNEKVRKDAMWRRKCGRKREKRGGREK